MVKEIPNSLGASDLESEWKGQEATAPGPFAYPDSILINAMLASKALFVLLPRPCGHSAPLPMKARAFTS